MNDESLLLLDRHRHLHHLLLYYLVAGADGLTSVVAALSVAFLSLVALLLLVESCLAPSFFLASFISSLAGAVAALAVVAGTAVVAGVAGLAGSVAKATVVTKVAIRVEIVFI